MADSKSSSILGFFYLIFQSYPGKYIKAWMDGSNDYTLYTPEEFIKMCKNAQIEKRIITTLSNCLTETSLFLWDVEANTIKRMSSKIGESNIGELISNLKNPVSKPLSEAVNIGWGSSIQQNKNGNIFIKF